MKLFGSTRSGAWLAGSYPTVDAVTVRRRNPLKALAIVLSILLLGEILYFTAVFSQNSLIFKWRNIYITTAMDTLTHQWLATAFIPDDIIQNVMSQRLAAQQKQVGMTSSWTKEPEPEAETEPVAKEIDTNVTVTPVETEEDRLAQAREAFFDLFYEIDEASMDAYLEAHPEALDNGWEGLYINEAGLNQSGTDIETIYGEQVLAIDARNQVLLIRVKGSGYQGVLAVAKDPSRLTVQQASTLGVVGETAGTIAGAHNGVLAMTASGFYDPDGGGNGGIMLGYAMCDGVELGSHMIAPNKRLELHEDNLMYIYDATDPVSEDCTNAVEWQPAMIIDGESVVPWDWDGIQPRACIGQSDRYEILMLVIEGRLYTKGILGTSLFTCADILLQHGCMQAMNVDGGTSAILWYDGACVTECSNSDSPEGRTLPTAFVYTRNS